MRTNVMENKRVRLEWNPRPVMGVSLRTMKLKLAAIRSGTEPVASLPGGTFHRWIDPPLTCPDCDVTYNVAAEWDHAVDRFFEDQATPLIRLLKKTIALGHVHGHRMTHLETSGVVVMAVTPEGVVRLG